MRLRRSPRARPGDPVHAGPVADEARLEAVPQSLDQVGTGPWAGAVR